MRRDGINLANVLGAVVIAALFAAVAVAATRDDAAVPAAGCDSQAAVQVSTTPEFAAIVQAAVDRLTDLEKACASYDVVVESAAVAAQQIAAGTALPQVWIPDSEVWIARANESETGPTLAAGPVLATTPVLLAVSDSLAPPSGRAAAQPWQQILDGPLQLRIEDPESSTAGLLTLASAAGAVQGTPEQDQLLLAATIRMSHERATVPELLAQVSGDDQGATAVATTEQQIAQQRADNPDSELATLVPAEGLGSLSYSWVVLPDQDQDPATRYAVMRLERSLMGVAGVLDRRDAGFRPADGAAGAATTTATGPTLATPSLDEADSVLADWDAAGGDHQILTVIDVSPSMLEPADGSTRIELVTAGLHAGLETIAPTAGVGLWMFSSDHSSGDDWTELAPIAPQDAQRADGGTHQETLLAEAATLEDRTGGGTSLYDTVRAAYQAVQEDYRSGFVNAVVVITDGREDDGLSLYQLLSELQAGADPDRRVPIYMVGVGPDVYEHELRLIAELTGGRYLLAPEPSDIGPVIVDAMTRPYRAE